MQLVSGPGTAGSIFCVSLGIRQSNPGICFVYLCADQTHAMRLTDYLKRGGQVGMRFLLKKFQPVIASVAKTLPEFKGYGAPNLLRTKEPLGDIAAIEVHIVPSAEAPTGVGETGTPPSAPALANAINALSGVHVAQLPM